jgi:hypothetical protein
VIACDSGSDKSFDFLGAAKVIAGLKELILTMWDRVVYYREKKLDAKLDLIGKALPIIGKIEELKAAGSLEPEQAELIKQKVLGGVHKLLETGIVIPEISLRATYNPRQLMAPEPKLLTVGTPLSAEDKAMAARINKSIVGGVVVDAASLDAEQVHNDRETDLLAEIDISSLSPAQRAAVVAALKTVSSSSSKRKPAKVNVAAAAKKRVAAKKTTQKPSVPPPGDTD